MSTENQPAATRVRPALLFTLAVVVALGLLVAGATVLNLDLRGLTRQALDLIGAAGAPVFFAAMAVLPALGAPLLFFTLTAGPVFGAQIGMPMVLILSLAAIATNMTLGYLLADRILRPALTHLMSRLGYRLPQVQSADAVDIVVLVRVTPGVPFPAQNYLPGLAKIPFVPYFIVSAAIALPLNTAIIFFGNHLLQGRGRAALVGLLVLVALLALTHLVRRHYQARSARAP